MSLLLQATVPHEWISLCAEWMDRQGIFEFPLTGECSQEGKEAHACFKEAMKFVERVKSDEAMRRSPQLEDLPPEFRRRVQGAMMSEVEAEPAAAEAEPAAAEAAGEAEILGVYGLANRPETIEELEDAMRINHGDFISRLRLFCEAVEDMQLAAVSPFETLMLLHGCNWQVQTAVGTYLDM